MKRKPFSWSWGVQTSVPFNSFSPRKSIFMYNKFSDTASKIKPAQTLRTQAWYTIKKKIDAIRFSNHDPTHRAMVILAGHLDTKNIRAEFRVLRAILAKEYGCGERQASRLIKALIEADLITIGMDKNIQCCGGWRRDRTYFISEKCAKIIENSSMISGQDIDGTAYIRNTSDQYPIGSPMSGFDENPPDSETWFPSETDQEWLISMMTGVRGGPPPKKPPQSPTKTAKPKKKNKKRRNRPNKPKRHRSNPKPEPQAWEVSKILFGNTGYEWAVFNNLMGQVVERYFDGDCEKACETLYNMFARSVDGHRSEGRRKMFLSLCRQKGIRQSHRMKWNSSDEIDNFLIELSHTPLP